MVGACCVLVFGWAFDVDAVRRIAPHYPAMVPATALTLATGGFGALALHRRWPRWQPIAATVILGGVIVLEQTAGLTPETLRHGDGMSLANIASALLLSASLALRTNGQDRAPIVSDTIGLIITMVPLIGYLLGSSALYDNPLYTQMALHTALGYATVFLALLLMAPQCGWIAILFEGEPGSVMARRVLPVAIMGPLILSLVATKAVERNLITAEFRLAVLTFLVIASTAAAVLGFAAMTNRAERRSTEAEAAYLQSERRRQKIELAAARSDKIAALGTLVGGVAHDFNNTLNVILGNLQLLHEDPDKNTHQGYVEEAIKASNRAAALTRQLLAYGRKSRLCPIPLVLEEEIASALTMFRRLCPANIAIRKEVDKSRTQVQLDPDAFQQAALNVLINARDALPNGGSIQVVTRTERLEGAVVSGFQDAETLPPGCYVTVRFEDDGIGMSPEIAAQATEPFFTTKSVGMGTGLGLSTAAGFCRQSKGGLRIDSTEGNGTTVTMAFPVYSGAPRAEGEGIKAGRKAPAWRHKILVVDDDMALARVMVNQLELDGHDVRLARDAVEALRALEDGPLPDVVLTDIVMPGEMQGHHLAVRIRQRFPDIRVILMSGYSSEGYREKTFAKLGSPFLQKPVDLRTLRTVIGSTVVNPTFPQAGR